MKQVRKGWLLLSVIFIMGVVAGCGLVKVDPEKDRKQIVANINGEKVLKGEVLDRYEEEKGYYYITDEMEKDPEQKEYILNVKKQILDSIVTEKLLVMKAEEAGFTVNDELREEAREDFNNIVKDIEASIKAQDVDNGEENKQNRDYAQEAREFVDNQLKAIGKTEEEYIELMAEYKCIELLMEETVKDIKVTDEDIQKYYEDELNKQKEDLTYMETATVKLYQPNRIRVKHILVKLPDEQLEEYEKLLNEAGQDEEKKKKAQEYLDEKLEELRPEAQAVLDRAKSGEDFDKLVKEENDDLGMDLEEGYVIHKETPFVEEFKNAAFDLEVGEISGLVASQYGFHIIKLYEKLPEETYSLDEKKEEIKGMVEENKKTEKWNSMVEEWKKEVEKFEERL